ncbi:MAG: ferrous iron transport protein A [Clostridiaceae bacterium]|nr:ferrous iron transport protein A [Clostridiaceae bacterium]
MSLYNSKINFKCIIEKLPQINLLKSIGVREGMTVCIKSKQPFGGPVVIEMGKRSVAIARDVAQQILVREVQ